MKGKTKMLHFRVDSDLEEAIKKAAKKEGGTVAQLIRAALLTYLADPKPTQALIRLTDLMNHVKKQEKELAEKEQQIRQSLFGLYVTYGILPDDWKKLPVEQIEQRLLKHFEGIKNES